MPCPNHIVFVSYEFQPINKGGCGVFIWNAVKRLLEETDIKITVLLDVSLNEIANFKKNNSYYPHRLEVTTVTELLEGTILEANFDDFSNIYLWKSYQFHQSLLVLNKRSEFNHVEFFDYAGAGYFSVMSNKYSKAFGETMISVRAHCTIDLMDAEQKQNDLNYEKFIMYEMEKETLQNADQVLVPSLSWKELYRTRYNIDEDIFIVSPLPLELNDTPEYSYNDEQKDVLFYGRLFELKGVDLFVEAAITYIQLNPETNTRFILVGYAGLTNKGGAYDQYLKDLIPDQYRAFFKFTGFVEKKQLNELLRSVAVAVFPNYVESFCYSIHELYVAGVPIICSDIPAFTNYFEDGVNSLVFRKNSSFQIYEKLNILMNNPNLRRKLSYPFPVLEKDKSFTDLYTRKVISKKRANKCKDQISLIVFEDGEKYFKIEDDNNSVDRVNSYLLTKCKRSRNSLSIYIFGERWNVETLFGEELNANLPINKLYWLGRSSDCIDSSFFKRSADILSNHNDINYVGSFSHRFDKKLDKDCSPLELNLKNHFYEIRDLMRVVVRTGKEMNLRELHDRRTIYAAQKDNISKGYLIPEFLVTTEKVLNVRNKAVLTLSLQSFKNNTEWKPFEIVSVLYDVNQLTNKKVSFLRSFYQKVRRFEKKHSSLTSKVFKFVLDNLYLIYRGKFGK